MNVRKILRLAMVMVLFVLTLSCSGDAQHDIDADSALLQGIVDEVISGKLNQQYGGISVAVKIGDRDPIMYAKGDLTPDTPSISGSIVKTFVAAQILEQIRKGKYSLNSTINELLGDNSDYRALSDYTKNSKLRPGATVRELLTHTSGIRDYADNLAGILPFCDPATPWIPGASVLEKVLIRTADAKLVGTFSYSSTNYEILGMIAEYKSGEKSLNKVMNQDLFGPLSLNHTTMPEPGYDFPLDAATGYDDAGILGIKQPPVPLGSFMEVDKALKLINPNYNARVGNSRVSWAAGGLWTTSKDLAKFAYELLAKNGKINYIGTIMKDSVAGVEYGYGLRRKSFTYDDGTAGLLYWHAGATVGHKNLLWYEEAKGISVAIMTNLNNSGPYGGGATLLVDQNILAARILNTFKDR